MLTQRERVLEYIRANGSITSWDAYKQLGVTQLATRIFELKELGYCFKKKRHKGQGRTHWDEYFLEESYEHEHT